MSYDDQFYGDRHRQPEVPPSDRPAGAAPGSPGQTYPPPRFSPQPPPRRRRRWPWVVAGLLLLLVIGSILANSTNPRSASNPPAASTGGAGLTSVGAVPSGGSDSQNVEEDATATAETNTRYGVTGSGRADITYQTDQGMEQRLNVALPFYVDVNATLASITAQRKSSSRDGEVVCTVVARGEEIARTTGQGAYAICVASGI